MKNNKVFLFLSLLLVISMVVNSCTKQTQLSSIQALFTSGKWELASVMRYNKVGSSQISVDTLNSNCDTTQFLTFTSNTNCTFTNYHCVDQPTSSGTWSLSANDVYLEMNMACKDTLPGGSCCTTAQAFANAAIVNIGQYSLLLETGNPGYYTENQSYSVYRYAFVRVSNTTN